MSRPQTANSTVRFEKPAELPDITNDDSLPSLLHKLSDYIEKAVKEPCTFDDLSNTNKNQSLEELITYLTDEVHHRCVLAALMILVGQFNALETEDARGVNLGRATGCEYVAWKFVANLSEREAIDHVLYELPSSECLTDGTDEENGGSRKNSRSNGNAQRPDRVEVGEETPLISGGGGIGAPGDMLPTFGFGNTPMLHKSSDEELLAQYENMNALEIGAVSKAKKLLSQRVVQRIIEQIWKGDIVFWETLGVNSIKQAKPYNKRKADPFCRLRVPRYLKAFEALFFISFLLLYYAVLVPVQRDSKDNRDDAPPPPGVPPGTNGTSLGLTDIHVAGGATGHLRDIYPAEILLYIWIVSFAYDEFGEYMDAGQAFYSADFWSLWDICIIMLGVLFFILRMVGLAQKSDELIGSAFDVLALEALFLIPRVCSLLSLNPYFGTLIPCLREMTKEFLKFLSLVVIIYLGFLTTFTLLARDEFTLNEMSWVLVKVFFGSSPLGFDVAARISPVLGAPLMLVFVTMTNMLLITSLIGLLSNSLIRILETAREEYLYIYSVYVLESSTSNRLTYFLPPFPKRQLWSKRICSAAPVMVACTEANLVPLLLRPLRLVLPTETVRRIRIVLLKVTHLPYVGIIWAYEGLQDQSKKRQEAQRARLSSSLGGPSGSSSNAGKKLSYLNGSKADTRSSSAMTNSQGSMSKDMSRKSTSVSPGQEALDDLKDLLSKLNDRVDELSNMVVDSKGSSRS